MLEFWLNKRFTRNSTAIIWNAIQYIYIYISSFYETLKKLHLSLNLSIFILIVLKIHPLVEVVSVKLPDPIGNQAGLE